MDRNRFDNCVGQAPSCAPVSTGATAGGTTVPRKRKLAPPRHTLVLLLIASTLSMSESPDRSKPPVTPPLSEYRLPPVQEGALENGLRYVLVEDRRFPLVTFRLLFPAGSKFDPKELSGLSETTGELLKEGTTSRTSRRMAEELASLGGSLGASSSPDSLVVSAGGLAENAARLLDILADAVRNAAFPQEEVDLRKQNRIQELEAERAQADTLAGEKFLELVFGGHPYSRSLPTPESIGRITRAALISFRDTHLIPNQAVLIALGSLPPREELTRLLRQKFGSWEKKPVPAVVKAAFPEAVRKIVLVDRPDSVQADIRVGRLAVDRTHPDYFPLLVANTILGGGASSRMFLNIREKQGFAYDARSLLAPRRERGSVAAITQVRNEVIGEAMKSVLAELERMAKEPVSAEELSDVKNYLNGVFVIGLETQGGLANQLAMIHGMGLPNDYLEKYVTRVRSVEPDQIQSVARRYLSPDNSVIVVVGDASKLSKPLAKFGPVTVEKAR